MPAPLSQPHDLAGWLVYIEALHPKSIAMGLDRVNIVRQRLNLQPEFPIITIAGTNGKGSTCAMLERIYHEAGYRVGCYTSPHLLRYNERVRIACEEISDMALCDAFAAVEAARQQPEPVALTYFEFGTLAAMWHFMHAGLDVAILEIGLGGRLDAVNAFDPNCAIVTSIALDHMDFLGNSRDSIGYEKAGIFRGGVAAICGDVDPPAGLLEHALSIDADVKLIRRDFDFSRQQDGWIYRNGDARIDLPLPVLIGDFQLFNAACVITAVETLQHKLSVTTQQMATGLRAVKLPGRYQQWRQQPQVVLDVAHNPQSALALAENLRQSPVAGRTLAVFAMLADKDIAGVIDAVREQIDTWYLADIEHARGATAQQLARLTHQVMPDCRIQKFTGAAAAYAQACNDAGENDRIVVFGSFYMVADVMRVPSQ